MGVRRDGVPRSPYLPGVELGSTGPRPQRTGSPVGYRPESAIGVLANGGIVAGGPLSEGQTSE